MESLHKLRVKIGMNEFEAEGEPEWLSSQLQTWRELVSAAPRVTPPTQPLEEVEIPIDGEKVDEELAPKLAKVFSVDKNKKLVSLRVQPTGNERDADAILLLLFGYAQLLGESDVLVGLIKESMAVSGLRVDRVDRAIAPHQTAGYVRKGGTAKGSKYRFTNTGENKARELVSILST
jgi:hypothetical protein